VFPGSPQLQRRRGYPLRRPRLLRLWTGRLQVRLLPAPPRGGSSTAERHTYRSRLVPGYPRTRWSQRAADRPPRKGALRHGEVQHRQAARRTRPRPDRHQPGPDHPDARGRTGVPARHQGRTVHPRRGEPGRRGHVLRDGRAARHPVRLARAYRRGRGRRVADPVRPLAAHRRQPALGAAGRRGRGGPRPARGRRARRQPHPHRRRVRPRRRAGRAARVLAGDVRPGTAHAGQARPGRRGSTPVRRVPAAQVRHRQPGRTLRRRHRTRPPGRPAGAAARGRTTCSGTPSNAGTAGTARHRRRWR
jgi:hypothetical protein